MLLNLHIENFILIEKVVVEFSSGFSVLTGETGAGKSIILDALQIVLGGKTSSKMLREPTLPATVTAEFKVKDHLAITDIMDEIGIVNDDSLIIRRVIGRDGKTRAFVNDHIVTGPVLQKLGKQLVEIFGQHDHHSLISPSMHRDTLDAYLQLAPYRDNVACSYKHWQSLCAKLQEMQILQSQSNSQQAYLQYVVTELEAFNYLPNEEEGLEKQRKQLLDYSKARDLLKEATDIMQGSNPTQQIRRLQSILEKKPDLFADIVLIIEKAYLEMQEAETQLNSMLYKYSHEDQDLVAIDNRFFAIKGMAKKYGVMPFQLTEFLQQSIEKLYTITNLEQEIELIEKSCLVAKKQFDEVALTLSQKRRDGAILLEQAVIKELKDLHMREAKFFVKITPQDANQSGIDKVFFEVVTNPDSKPDALQNIASGGEMSRIMLALKVALSDIKSINTMIFDEVDTGIGGAVAGSVGLKLAQLGQGKQILAITHQPQIAACALHQYHVCKSIVDGFTHVSITKLAYEERVQEIARMLAGNNISAQAQEAAIALLNANGNS